MTLEPVLAEDAEAVLSEPLPWEQLDGATVLITGANGMLAAQLVEVLLRRNERGAKGTQVLALVRDEARGRQRFSRYEGRADLRFIVHDFRRPLPELASLDYVIHAASQASPKYYGRDPLGTIWPNVFGTQQLLDAAVRLKSRRFLFFSSGEVYGQVAPERIPIREGDYGWLDPVDPRSCYAESKRMGEQLCVAYSQQRGLHTSIVRPFHTYGPGMALDDGRVFADFVADIVHRRNLVMKSDGRAVRPYCYASDASRAFFSVLLNGAPATPYNVGNPAAELSVLELAELLVRTFPELGLEVSRATPSPGYLSSPISRNCPDITRISGLGWTPRVGPAEGFQRTVRSLT